ncbi:transcription initiation factor TFIID subunit 4-like isoform X2 [Ciona intestinalis]
MPEVFCVTTAPNPVSVTTRVMTSVGGVTNPSATYVSINAHTSNNNAMSTTAPLKPTPGSTTGGTKYIQLQSVRSSPGLAPARAASPQLIGTPTTIQGVPSRPRTPNSGLAIPPGMVLTRGTNGQLMIVNGNPTTSGQQVTSSNQTGTPAARTVTTIAATSLSSVTTVGKPVPVASSVTQVSKAQETKLPQAKAAPITLSQDDIVNVNKCRNFLTTLIKLASTGGQLQETVRNVKALVQNLIDDKICPEDFTKRLQVELNSSPQPYLVPFLKKSLPLLRLTMMQQNQGGASPAVAAAAQRVSTLSDPKSAVAGKPKPVNKVVRPVAKNMRSNVPDIRLPRVTSNVPPMKHPSLQNPQPHNSFHPPPHPSSVSGARTSSLTAMGRPISVMSNRAGQRWNATGSGGTYKDDDDINDVASMAGVNLSEESARILATNSELVGTQTRSCQDDAVLNAPVLQKRMTEIAARNPEIQHIHADAVKFLSCAAETRIKDLLEKVAAVVCHRMTNFKEEDHYKACSDVKMQLKFLQELDQIEKKKHDEAERDILMRAIKSRSKNDNPEQLRLKERAKEMQQLELEKMQIRNADETARNAIGPRKKKARIDSPLASNLNDTINHINTPSSSRGTARSRMKRVNLRDLIFVMEHEKGLCRTKSLYASYLK